MSLDLDPIREHLKASAFSLDNGHRLTCGCAECSVLWRSAMPAAMARDALVEDVPLLIAEVEKLRHLLARKTTACDEWITIANDLRLQNTVSLPLTDADDYEWKYDGHKNPHLFQRNNAEVWGGGAWKVYDPPTEGKADDHYTAFYQANAVDGWRSRCKWCGDWAEDDDGDTEMHAMCDPDFMKDIPYPQRPRFPGEDAVDVDVLEDLVKACEGWIEYLGPDTEDGWRHQGLHGADHLAAIRAAVKAAKAAT